MAQQNDDRTKNHPNHEQQVKGGQHSHSGSESQSNKSASGGSHQQPSHEQQVKGGQHSHSGGGSQK